MDKFEELCDKLENSYLIKDKTYKEYHKRDLFFTLSKDLQSGSRIKIISGLRGIGKTSLLMHLKRGIVNAFYLSFDDPFLKTVDPYEFLIFLIEKKGIKTIFIDEAHNLNNWNKIIKALYDTYNEVVFILSGSSALGLYNLDRRAIYYDLSPLTFSEFLNYKNMKLTTNINWKDFKESQKFVITNNLEKEYNEYIYSGGFTFTFDLSKEDFIKALYNSIMKSIKDDAPLYSKISSDKIFGLEKIITNLALTQPGELSITSLCNEIKLSKDTTYELLDILEKMKIIKTLRTNKKSKLLRAEAKLLFSHPNIRFALAKTFGFNPNFGAMREEFALMHLSNLGFDMSMPDKSKKTPDFIATKGPINYLIEIGGNTKGKKQFEGKQGIVLKDENLIVLGLTKK